MSLLRSLPLYAAAALCCASLPAQSSISAARIVDRIDDSQLVALKGNTHPAARAANDRGPVNPGLPMTSLVLVLKRAPEQQAAFDRYVSDLYDPASPDFHQWLEPAQVGEDFGPNQADIAAISGWLSGHGFSVDEVGKDRMSIRFSGTAAQVGEAFHTQIHNLSVRGVHHIANMSDPQIPAAMAQAVAGVKALHDFHPQPLHRLGGKVTLDRASGKWKRPAPAAAGAKPGVPGFPSMAHPEFGINVPAGDGNDAYLVEDVAPYDFAAIYNVLPAWNAGYKGTGQTIAIAGTSEIAATDVSTFRSSFGLPAGPAIKQVVGNGTNPGECGVTPTDTCSLDDQVENTLDVEWSGAVAPEASIVLVASGYTSDTDDAVYDSSHYVVENKTAPILNVSYGLCELGEGTAGNTLYNNMWQTAASEGIAVFVATGDSGSASCDDGGDFEGTPYAAEYGLTVSGLASTPYDTAVGGTDLNWGATASPYWSSTNNASTGASALGYMPEVPWNDTCTSPMALSYIQSAAHAESVSTPNDAETACNFVVDFYQYVYEDYGVDISWLLDTIGGGGGKSSCTTGDGQNPTSCSGGYAKPAWQANVTGIPSDGKRDIPDVSFFASNGFLGSAYLMCISAGGSACTYSSTSENTAQEIGGTSASSPAMAGVMALINQKAGAPQGSPNTELYKLAAKQSYLSCSSEKVTASSSCYFNDIDTQTNAQPCDAGALGGASPNCNPAESYDGMSDGIGVLSGYNAVEGYDQATGLGTLNVSNVVNAWPAATVPLVSLSKTSLTFAGTLKGTSSASQAITLSNTGNSALTLSGTGKGITVAGTNASSFVQTNTCGSSVAAGAKCTVTVTFKPAAAGTLTASLSVADNATGSPQTVALTGVGTAPAVSLSSTSLGFAATAVGGTATSKVTLKNTGTGALSLSGTGLGISVTGANAADFKQTNTCGASVAAGASCVVTVTFAPAVPGALAASVNIADSASGSPQKIALTGTGLGAEAALSHTAIDFPSTKIGVASTALTFSVTNKGNVALALSGSGYGIAMQGTAAMQTDSYIESNNCGSSLAAGKACTVSVIFKPLLAGTIAADVRIASNATGATLQKVALSGPAYGPGALLSKSSLTFAATTVGATSAKQYFTLTNVGNQTLTLTGSAMGITMQGTNETSFAETNTCGSSLAKGASCTVTVTFKPTVKGALTADVRFGDNATGSPQKVYLTGTGQ